MDAGEVWVLLQDFTIFLDRFRILLALHITLRLQYMEQIGIGVYTRQLVQGLERSSLVESRQLKQNIGVVGIFVKQNIKLIDSFARATERLKRHRFVITSAAIFGVGVKLFVEGLCRFFKA